MQMYVTLLSHLVPVIFTILIVTLAIVLVKGIPKLKYILYVSEAHTPEGREDFARYLAKKTGGKGINVDNNWPSFIPAAKELHKTHLNNLNQS